MTDMDIDTQTEEALEVQDANAPLPWESIDPQEQPADYISPFASTGISAEGISVEAKSAGVSPLLLNEFSVLENETASKVSESEREEQLADRAFFSDEKISIEMLASAPIAPDATDAASDVPARRFASVADPFSVPAPARGEDLVNELLGQLEAEHTPQSERLNEEESHAEVEASAPKLESSVVEFVPEAEEFDHASRFSSTNIAIQPARIDSFEIETTPSDIDPPAPSPLYAGERAGVRGPSVESADSETIPSPRPSPLSTEAREQKAVTAPETIDDVSVEPVHPSEEGVTPEAHQPVGPIVTDSNAAVVSRTIPADAVHDTTITFSSSDSLLSAASELAALAESFADEEVEQPGDQTILVSVSEGDHLSGLTDVSPQLAIQPRLATETEVELDEEVGPPVSSTGGGWTIPLLCMGIGLIACCVVIPQGEANRRLRYEQVTLAADLQQVQKQVAVNDEFLKNVSDDPTLAERLAGRQMKTIRKGQTVIDLKEGAQDSDMSPFSLVAIAKPVALPPYHARTGTIANLCNNARSRLYLLGAALGMVAVGLVMGFSGTNSKDNAVEA